MSRSLGHESRSSNSFTDSDAAPQAALIEADQLVKHYGETQAVRGVSFRVTRGEVVGFLGPNGAGKSTTMKMLTGFLRPTSGRARIMGIDMAHDALEAQRHIGYLPENAPLYDDMMVIDFLRFVADLRGLSPQRRSAQLRSVTDRCGLGSVLGKDISQLSKGYRQRVGLAQALLDDADLLILDEPTSGLDPNQIVEIRALIRDLGRDKTVLLSTHILSEVQAVCDRAIIINNGRLIADATPEQLGAQAHGGVRMMASLRARGDGVLEHARIHKALMALPLVTEVQAAGEPHDREASFFVVASGDDDALRESLFDLAVSEKLILSNLQKHEASLEETFQRLTGAQESPAGGRHAA